MAFCNAIAYTSTQYACEVTPLMTALTQLRNTLGALFLIVACPPAVMLIWYTLVYLDGSLANLWTLFAEQGFWTTLTRAWGPVFWGSKTAWTILGVFAAVQLAFMRLLPGKMFKGPITPEGNVPVYKANGVLSYACTLALWFLGAYVFHWFSPTIIYDHFGELLGALNIFSLFFCVFLMVKGRLAPSSSDTSITGNWVFDFYWGTELYPRLAGWDMKMFTNCRFALMSWPLILLSFAAKQQAVYGISDSMIVAVALQLIYVTKFFAWETGYLSSLDIMHDHAGFYICWGCLVWVPGIYTSSTLYLVNHPNHLGLPLALFLFTAGAACILANYFADRQRQKVRQLQGQCKVWGQAPVLIQANYVTEKGEAKTNLLLASGWWGIARHFHYIPEILGAFFWTVPALFVHVLPYFYVVFLTLLLVDRAFRDDQRCGRKYGPSWQEYCQKVPYKIIPYVV
jgi:7-dehydrocholesterol reductase